MVGGTNWIEIGSVATGVGALITAWLARATSRSATAAAESVKLERENIDAALASIRSSERPVVVPVQRDLAVQFRGGTVNAVRGPHTSENLPRYAAAFIVVENIGKGPALNVRGVYRGPKGEGAVRFPVEGIGVGGTGVVAFENWDGSSLGYTGNDKEVTAELEYEDVAGRTYKTSATFDIGNNAYRSQLE